MDYKDILQRYYEGRTSLEEEQALRRYLISADTDSLTPNEKAAHLMIRHATRARQESVNVKLHHTNSLRWQIAGAMALCALLIGGIYLSRPTIYGYHNGRPITSLQEAEFYSQQILAELTVSELQFDRENLLQDMFKLK